MVYKGQLESLKEDENAERKDGSFHGCFVPSRRLFAAAG